MTPFAGQYETLQLNDSRLKLKMPETKYRPDLDRTAFSAIIQVPNEGQ